MSLIPEKTIERISRYRNLLNDYYSKGNEHIYSYELAAMANTNPAQIRQDIMNVGYSGSPRKGYIINDLINCISNVLDSEDVTKIVLIGAGNLGKAILNYYKGNRPKLSIVAAFDNDQNKINRVVSGVRCYHINEAQEIIKEKNITVGIIATTGDAVDEAKDVLIQAGIKAILNFTSIPIKVPPNIYLEEIDITVILEKVAYFAKHSGKHKKV